MYILIFFSRVYFDEVLISLEQARVARLAAIDLATMVHFHRVWISFEQAREATLAAKEMVAMKAEIHQEGNLLKIFSLYKISMIF